jgi:HlyD family secretion protein
MGLVGVGVVLALAGVSAVAVPALGWLRSQATADRAHLATVPVRRTDLDVRMRTGGRVDSAERTTIECALENIEYRTRGGGMSVGGASTLLEVLPEGTLVKKGDVLAVMDASDYEELVRQQLINVERVRADYRQAELNQQVARMAVGEYRDGLLQQNLETLKGQLALTASTRERAADRLEWSRRMFQKGYLSKGQLTTEEFNLANLSLQLTKGRTALRLFESFSAPIYLKILDSDVMSADSMLSFQARRLQRSEERLDYYKRMVESCTLRAPHDGYLIYYYDERGRDIRIEAGMTVRQRQKLFYLPDLSKMEVAAMIHESVVKDVQPGMRAHVQVEALPNQALEGHVESIAQLPMQNFFSDVRYFVGTIRLDTVPKGLLPGMTAEVNVTTLHKPDVLVIPSEALAVEQGHDVCYVAHDSGVERREVKIGQATRELLEVTSGLEEGEEVVLDPANAFNPVASAPAEDAGDAAPVVGSAG